MKSFGSPAPLYDALVQLADKGYARFHMPGHKGFPPRGDSFSIPDGPFGLIERIDFTELDETGNLYQDGGPVALSEALTARVFGAEECVFLTCGSTQGIMAALAALSSEGDVVIVDRGCHKAVYNAMALLGLNPVYAIPDHEPEFGIPAGIAPGEMERAVEEAEALSAKKGSRVSACIVTSPTYHGFLLDIPALASVLGKRDVPLIVDAAHGSHLPFMGHPSSIEQGAAIEICSAHKTLPALGQGAWLFAREAETGKRARKMAAVFGTSSPSYAVMASLDAARAYMLGEGRGKSERVKDRTAELRGALRAGGLFIPLDGQTAKKYPGLSGIDPMRLTVNTAAAGISGNGAARVIKQTHGVVCEMSDSRSIVFILSPADLESNMDRLRASLLSLSHPENAPPLSPSAAPPRPVVAVLPRRAFFAPKTALPLSECEGRICGEIIAPYPPGVPIVSFGEVFTKIHIAYLNEIDYNIDKQISVLK